LDWNDNIKNGLNRSNKSRNPVTWKDSPHNPMGDYEPTYWLYSEKTTEQFVTGVLENLFAKDNVLTFPDEFGWCFGPAVIGDTTEINQDRYHPYSERLWVVWKNNAGEMWMAKSNSDFTEFEWKQQLLFVPSGANNPTITFDENGNYVLAVDLIPPGLEESEIWLMEYPYRDAAVRRVAYGKRPKLFMDHTKDVLLFYHNDDTIAGDTQIKYIAKSENYASEHILPVHIGGIKTVYSVRYYWYGPEQKPDYNMAALVAYKVQRERITRYLITTPLVTYPIEASLGDDGLNDKVGAYCGVQGIIWDEAFDPYINISAHENVGAYCGVVGISWVLNTLVEVQLDENVEPIVAIRDIEWREIIFTTKQLDETVGASVGVRSILWVEV